MIEQRHAQGNWSGTEGFSDEQIIQQREMGEGQWSYASDAALHTIIKFITRSNGLFI